MPKYKLPNNAVVFAGEHQELTIFDVIAEGEHPDDVPEERYKGKRLSRVVVKSSTGKKRYIPFVGDGDTIISTCKVLTKVFEALNNF